MTAGTTISLRAELARRLSQALPADLYDGPHHMEAAARRIDDLLSGTPQGPVDVERLRAAVSRLAAGAELTDQEARLCSMGATTPFDPDATVRIVDDHALTQRLLERLAPAVAAPRVRSRCARGLAHALLLPSQQLSAGAEANAGELAEVVVSVARAEAESGTRTASSVLLAIAALFASRSTEQFWPYVLARDTSVLMPLSALRAPSTSWLWDRIVLDAIDESARRGADVLRTHTDNILTTLADHETALDVGLGRVLAHLARLAPHEHVSLRDASVDRWGSPLLAANQPKWERHAGEDARRMVAGWLARRVIAAFFEALTSGGGDIRRSAFWSQYGGAVDEFWLYLSEHTRRAHTDVVREMRRALGPTVRSIDTDHVSAFVMMSGRYAFVEFSVTGHALYVYDRDRLPFSLRDPGITLAKMRDQAIAVERVVHSGAWESRTAEVIGTLTGHWRSRLHGR